MFKENTLFLSEFIYDVIIFHINLVISVTVFCSVQNNFNALKNYCVKVILKSTGKHNWRLATIFGDLIYWHK